MQNKKIPVFYHIPKNAGTYVSDWFMIAFRHYIINKKTQVDIVQDNIQYNFDSIRVVQPIKNEHVIARFFLEDNNKVCNQNEEIFCKKHTKYRFDLDWNLFSKNFLNKFTGVFGIIIESYGFKKIHNILELFSEYDLLQFLILRDPFFRAQSIYNYNKSEESKHDYSHGLFLAKSLEDHILSEQLEDSWLIRNLNQIEDTIPLEEKHFIHTKDVLKNFKIYDIKDTDKAIQEVFLECYDININKLKLNPWDRFTKNETTNKKIKFQELSLKAQTSFKERTYWDEQLFKKFIK